MICIITGNGKGKTTSALGTALRASGWGKKVAILFFDKGGSHYGEDHTLSKIQDIDVFRFGLKRFDEKTKTFRFENVKEDAEEVKKGLNKLEELLHTSHLHSHYNVVVCDELINSLNVIEKDEIEALLDKCPKETHLILTGRNAPSWLIEKADLVSEIKEVKHYFKNGNEAIKGLDY